MAALDERRERIADGLAAADKGQQAEAEGLKQADHLINEAKAQASEILGKAEKRGNELVDEAKGNAKTEGERLLAAAQAEIESETNKAREGLRGQVGSLAVAGARQILGREIDEKAHADLLDKLAAKL